MQQHYFSAQPLVHAVERTLEVNLNNQKYHLSTSSGVFSPGHLDQGTQTLLKYVPKPSGNNLLDLGCGWGPLALTMALQTPQATVYAVDVNERSLLLTEKNAHNISAENIVVSTPEKVDPALLFHTIWSNPPIRIGKVALHELLYQWLSRLAPGGRAFLVVAKKLGADSLLRWLQETFPAFECTRYAKNKGFNVLYVANNSDS